MPYETSKLRRIRNSLNQETFVLETEPIVSAKDQEVLDILKIAMDTLDKNMAIKRQALTAAHRITELGTLPFLAALGQKK